MKAILVEKLQQQNTGKPPLERLKNGNDKKQSGSCFMGLLIRHVIAGACAARLAHRLNVVLAGKRHQGGKQQWQRGQQLASDDFHSVSREK